MRYRSIGDDRFRFEVSDLCLGVLPFGTIVDEATSFAILDRFVEAGGTFIDTSNNYCCWLENGTGDESEDLLGRWIAARRAQDRVVVATKAGARPDPAYGDRWPGNMEGLSAETLRRALKGSLGRLGVERVGVYYAHVEDRRVPLDETVDAFAELIGEGLVGLAGVSNHTTGRIRRARLIAEAAGKPGFSVVQQRYTFLRPLPTADFGVQEHVDDELLDYAAGQQGLTLFGYSALVHDMYSRDDREIPQQYRSPSATRQVAGLREIAADLGATPNQLVLSWMLHSDPPVVPLIGVSSVAQLDECLGALDLNLAPAVMAALSSC